MEFRQPMNLNPRLHLMLGLVSFLACGLSLTRAEKIVLKDGTEIEGIITSQTATHVGLTQGRKTRFIRREDISTILFPGERSLNEPAQEQIGEVAHLTTSVPPATPASSLKWDDPIADSTVRVFATVSVPDVRKPWAKLPPREETGSGFVIGGKRILTSAHILEYATDIQICANQASDKIPAKVIAIDTSRDLAALKLDDEKFFDSHGALSPMPLIPRTRDILEVHGYSDDSANVTVRRPLVTTVEFTAYDTQVSGLIVRINSELEPGTSGGPVTHGARNVMGIASCRPFGNTSYSFVIPGNEIETFLDGITKGQQYLKPRILDEVQKLENPALREYLKLSDSVHGVVINSSANKDERSLLDWDVLTNAMGDQIDDQGTVTFADYRINFGQSVQQFPYLPEVEVSVFRGGQLRKLSVPLEKKPRMLISDLEGTVPSYFIFGPIVFSTVSTQLTSFVSSSEQWEAYLRFRGSPLVTRLKEMPSFPGEQLVVVPAPFFPHELVRGYGDPTFAVVKAVNGVPIRNLEHLVRVLRDSKDDFVTIEFVDKYTEILVFSRAEMIAATDGILNDNNVRSQGSADTMAVWNAK
jgi:S1-C subfamily serine protease